MATSIQLADSAPWKVTFQDGHFHPTWLYGGQKEHGHIQPTVDSSKVIASKFQNALPESKHFPFLDPKWHLATFIH